MKKLISLIICAAMLAGAALLPSAAFDTSNSYFPPSAWELKTIDTGDLGDVNDDGSINALDALVLRRFLVDDSVKINRNASDLTAKGNINAKDLLYLRLALADIVDLPTDTTENAVDSFTIAGNDISEYSIIVPVDSTINDNAGNAADTLRRFVRYATGINLSIHNGYTAVQTRKIEFHSVDEASELGKKLEIENYIYEVKNGDLHIYGTRRGNLYAVWEILEDYLGYRFYSDAYTFEYEMASVDIPEGTYVMRHPALDFRFARGVSFGSSNLWHLNSRHINGSQSGSPALQWGTQTGPEFINAHSYGYYWRMATGTVNWGTASNESTQAAYLYQGKYDSGIQQDEWNWNPCFTSDDDYNILFRGLLETLRYCQTWRTFRYPTSSMSFSICDNTVYCTCRDCRLISSDEYFPRLDEFGQGAGGAGLCVYLANRACRDIKEYYEGRAASWEDMGDNDAWGLAITDEYPELSIYTIIYDNTMPTTVLPEENLILMYCCASCNSHYLGSGECEGKSNNLDYNRDGNYNSESLKAWGKACHDAGAEMWYWYYASAFMSLLCESPNVTNIYHDIKFLVEECYVNGVFFEGSSYDSQLGAMKGHLASEVMWSVQYDANGNMTMMSEAEFHEEMKEYLELFYGEGYMYVYEYLMMYEEASNAVDTHCYLNNYDFPGDMFSYSYMKENYLYMRGLLEEAYKLADTENYANNNGDYYYGSDSVYENASQQRRVEWLLAGCDTLGLSANKAWYYGEEGEEYKAMYENNYTWLYNFIKSTDMSIWPGDMYKIPAELDLSTSPLVSFYGMASRCDSEWNYVD